MAVLVCETYKTYTLCLRIALYILSTVGFVPPQPLPLLISVPRHAPASQGAHLLVPLMKYPKTGIKEIYGKCLCAS